VAAACHAVIGYEPDPRWRERLKVPSNVTIVEKAIAARAGSLKFHVNEGLCSSLHYTDTRNVAIDVEAVTLEDALSMDPGRRIEIIKMDIEGEEVPVLLEAPPELFRRVVQLTVEFHDFLDPSLTPAIRRIRSRFKELGFVSICFSRRFHGDVLFVNRRLVTLGPLQLFWLVARYKYLRGIGRMVSRLVTALTGRR